MRTLQLKYAGECRACGSTLPAGTAATYERRVGVFCPTCAPTDPEEIRNYRQEGADRKADRYGTWAAKRRERATATLDYNRKHYMSDIAFVTQPGHFPLRARVIRQDDRAYESLRTAERMQQKADNLRTVRVAGDAERARQGRREAVLGWLRVGMKVDTVVYGLGEVVKINRKTAKVRTGVSGTWETNVDLSFLRPLAASKGGGA